MVIFYQINNVTNWILKLDSVLSLWTKPLNCDLVFNYVTREVGINEGGLTTYYQKNIKLQ